MNTMLEVICKNKRKITILLMIVIIFILVLFFTMYIYNKIEEKNNNIDISNAIHGVIIKSDVAFYKKPKESKWRIRRYFNIGENVYIVEEFTDDEQKQWYKVKAKDKVGYVLKDNVDFFKFSENENKSLMSDVSKFNIQFEHFKTMEDYQLFILNNCINYVYIRAGGRGYGDEGNFYKDSQYNLFINACEYLGVPYGFYYIDEALNSEEIDEEVQFVENFIKENATSWCKLPLVIDIENHDGVGRADKIWEERKFLVAELIDKFTAKNIKTIVYANASIANKYLYELNTKFWLAYYNLEEKIPNYWYTDTGQEAVNNIELMEKMVAWQFTENGAGKEISYPVDISIVDNQFFKQYLSE